MEPRARFISVGKSCKFESKMKSILFRITNVMIDLKIRSCLFQGTPESWVLRRGGQEGIVVTSKTSQSLKFLSVWCKKHVSKRENQSIYDPVSHFFSSQVKVKVKGTKNVEGMFTQKYMTNPWIQVLMKGIFVNQKVWFFFLLEDKEKFREKVRFHYGSVYSERNYRKTNFSYHEPNIIMWCLLFSLNRQKWVRFISMSKKMLQFIKMSISDWMDFLMQ